MSNEEKNPKSKRKGILSLFKGANNGGGSCCNVKIVPKDQPAKESNKGGCCEGGCCNIKIVPKEQATENKDSK